MRFGRMRQLLALVGALFSFALSLAEYSDIYENVDLDNSEAVATRVCYGARRGKMIHFPRDRLSSDFNATDTALAHMQRHRLITVAGLRMLESVHMSPQLIQTKRWRDFFTVDDEGIVGLITYAYDLLKTDMHRWIATSICQTNLPPEMECVSTITDLLDSDYHGFDHLDPIGTDAWLPSSVSTFSVSPVSLLINERFGTTYYIRPGYLRALYENLGYRPLEHRPRKRNFGPSDASKFGLSTKTLQVMKQKQELTKAVFHDSLRKVRETKRLCGGNIQLIHNISNNPAYLEAALRTIEDISKEYDCPIKLTIIMHDLSRKQSNFLNETITHRYLPPVRTPTSPPIETEGTNLESGHKHINEIIDQFLNAQKVEPVNEEGVSFRGDFVEVQLIDITKRSTKLNQRNVSDPFEGRDDTSQLFHVHKSVMQDVLNSESESDWLAVWDTAFDFSSDTIEYTLLAEKLLPDEFIAGPLSFEWVCYNWQGVPIDAQPKRLDPGRGFCSRHMIDASLPSSNGYRIYSIELNSTHDKIDAISTDFVHGGGFVVSTSRLRRLIDTGTCLSNQTPIPHWRYTGYESVFSEIFYRCNLTKVTPLHYSSPWLIEHFPRNHVATDGVGSQNTYYMTYEMLRHWATDCEVQGPELNPEEELEIEADGDDWADIVSVHKAHAQFLDEPDDDVEDDSTEDDD